MPEPAKVPAHPLVLNLGRPRTPAYVVLIALLLRGYCGAGFKSAEVTSAMQESITLCVFFTNLGLKMSGRSTLTELVNAVSNETRLLLLDAQLARAFRLKLDDFKTVLQDSTHVAGNTEDRKIEVISINGAKGRALTSRVEWESDPYAAARDKRSAIESLMFTLKHGFDFGEVARRGLLCCRLEQ